MEPLYGPNFSMCQSDKRVDLYLLMNAMIMQAILARINTFRHHVKTFENARILSHQLVPRAKVSSRSFDVAPRVHLLR